MKRFLLAGLALALLAAPLELSARHVVKHHVARAQGCNVGQAPPSTGCGIGDMQTGGALTSTDAIQICQQPGGCPASASTWQLTKIPLLPNIRSSLSALPPLGYNSSTGAFSLTGVVPPANLGTGTPSSSVFLNGAGAWATPPGATGGVTIPTSPLLSGNSTSTLGSVAVGPGLLLAGTYPNQTLSAGPIYRDASTTVTAADWTAGAMYVYTTGTPTLTFPAVSTLSQQGGVTISSLVPVTLKPNAVDGINGYAINTQVPMDGNFTTTATTSGTTGVGALTIPLGEAKVIPFSWGPNMNLATVAIPLVTRPGSPTTITALTCMPGGLAPSSSSIDVCYAPDGTVPTAGAACTGTGVVRLTTTSCNAGPPGVAGTQQGGLATAGTIIPAGNHLWVVGSGSGWAGTITGISGKLQVSLGP